MSALQAEMLELDYLTKLNHEGKSHLRTEEKKKETASESQHLDCKPPATMLYGLIKID